MLIGNRELLSECASREGQATVSVSWGDTAGLVGLYTLFIQTPGYILVQLEKVSNIYTGVLA
jgi:hypothetical protein